MVDRNQDDRDSKCDSAGVDDKAIQPIVEIPLHSDSAQTIDRSDVEDAPSSSIVARGLVGSTILLAASLLP
mgnify:CR=1 FL=1|jgi:hypothetical protein